MGCSWPISPLGRALVDKRLYLPKHVDPTRTGVLRLPEDRRNYRSKTELALEMLERVLEPQGRVGCRRRRLRDVADLPGGTGGPMRYVLEVPGGTTVWPLDPAWTSPEYPGFGPPQLRPGQRRTMEALPDEAWREITVAQGSQGPRTYRFSAQRVRATRRLWAVWRRNLDGSEPRYYLSNPEGTTLETLAYVGGSRWRIETELDRGANQLGRV